MSLCRTRPELKRTEDGRWFLYIAEVPTERGMNEYTGPVRVSQERAKQDIYNYLLKGPTDRRRKQGGRIS